MIFVVEVPHQGRPHAWFAFNQEDFVRKVQLARSNKDWIIYEVASARERLSALGLDADSPATSSSQPALYQQAQSNGWDTPLYRADYVLGQGELQAEEIDAFTANVAALAHDLKHCRVHPNEAQAIAALHCDPLYDPDAGFYAHMALREQLIALDAMEEDI